MEVLLNVEPVLSSHNLKRLRQLYDQLESHVRSLKSLGVTPESYGSLLSSVLLNKLPSELRLIISRKVSERDWNLMKEVEQEVEARERAQGNTSQSTYTPPPRRTREPQTATTLLTGGASNIVCAFCQQAHSCRTNRREKGDSTHIGKMLHLPEERTSRLRVSVQITMFQVRWETSYSDMS